MDLIAASRFTSATNCSVLAVWSGVNKGWTLTGLLTLTRPLHPVKPRAIAKTSDIVAKRTIDFIERNELSINKSGHKFKSANIQHFSKVKVMNLTNRCALVNATI